MMARFLLFASGRGVIGGDVKAMGPAVVVVLKATNCATNDLLRFGGRSRGASGDWRCGCVLWGDRRDAIEGELGLQGRHMVSVQGILVRELRNRVRGDGVSEGRWGGHEVGGVCGVEIRRMVCTGLVEFTMGASEEFFESWPVMARAAAPAEDIEGVAIG